MTQKQINKLIKLLKSNGVIFDEGLSESEINNIKNIFGIQFSPDLKLFLQTRLPVSEGFVHWRYGINSNKGKEEIQNRLDWPKEGMLFDIKHNTFWLEDWGLKPKEFEKQKQIAVIELNKKPKLIPIYSHRYIPSKPQEIGNTVFSVYQMDIIHYGVDLADYFSHEFGFKLSSSFGKSSYIKEIDFWNDMVELNNR